MLQSVVDFFKNIFQNLKDMNFFEVFKSVSIIFTALFTIYKIVQRGVQGYRFDKLKLNGYYLSKRTYSSIYKPEGKTLFELIEIKFTIINSKGKPIYIYKDQDYKMKFEISKEHSSVINGSWRSLKDPNNYGSFAWNFSDDYIEGYWSSATRDGDIAHGVWELQRVNSHLTGQLKRELGIGFLNKLKNWVYSFFETKKSKALGLYELYDNILEKHKNEPNKPFVFNSGNEYDIHPNVFNPQFGKIGRPLIEYVLQNEQLTEFPKILDWGTGCGYYMIEIEKKLNAVNPQYKNSLYAVELHDESLLCARVNFGKFHCSDKIKVFTGGRLSDIQEFKSLEFDLIIANLPFSRPEALTKHKKSKMYNCFCADASLVFNLAFEIKNFLSKNGKAYVAFADSGNKDLFFDSLALVSLSADEKLRIDQSKGAKDDIFYVYCITHSL